MKKSIIFIGLLCSCHLIYAKFENFHLGTGVINQFVNKVQTSRGGDENSFDHRVVFELGGTYGFNESWKVIPTFGLLFPGGADDENIKMLTYYTQILGAYELEKWSFQAGFGLYIMYLKSDGGTVQLPNGTGTDTFYLPSESSNTRNITTVLATQYEFLPDWSSKIQAMIFNPVSSENRALSYTLTFNYHFSDLWF